MWQLAFGKVVSYLISLSSLLISFAASLCHCPPRYDDVSKYPKTNVSLRCDVVWSFYFVCLLVRIRFLGPRARLINRFVFWPSFPNSLIIGCIIPSFLSGILYCTDSGLYFLDVIDFYVNFVMLLVGFLEAFGAAWAYGILDQYSTVGVKATLSYMMANFVPFLVVSFSYSSKAWVSFVAAIGVGVFGLAVTHYFLVKRMARQPGRWTLRSIWFECAFGNIW